MARVKHDPLIDLSPYALKSNVLELDNTNAFTPDTDYEPATKKYVDDNLGGGQILPSTFHARLTLESGVPISTSDQTAKTTLYLTPYDGNIVGLYNTGTSSWEMKNLAEISATIPSTTNTNYDVFVYDNSGTLTLEFVAWTNSGAGTSTRTALGNQDGIKVKSGEVNKRYVGSIRTTSVSGQCEDSQTKRFIWNNYNKVGRILKRIETTGSWTYTSTTFRSWNNSTVNRVEFITGFSDEPIKLQFSALGIGTETGTGFATGIGLNKTNGNDADLSFVGYGVIGTIINSMVSNLEKNLFGYNFLQAVERNTGGGTVTFYGTLTSLGLLGNIKA